jgi:tryptophan 2,3-dioxygenase
LREQLDKVQQDSAQTAMRVNGITSDVSAVKDQVGSAHSRIDQTNSAMQSMRGDLGVMSGLIATNQSEIEQLRKLGDRNIYEFTLHKRDGQQKVGDIQVRLERVNAKRNRYTVVVNADDKLIEKKDKTTNEPVQFYVISKARQPYELVVNEVGKDTIKGYLATPKIQLSRAETAAAQ